MIKSSKSSFVRHLLTLALGVTALSSASATSVRQYLNGDLLLGFYDTTGASTNDYLIDLGPIANFNLNANFTLSLGLSSDLVTTFGSTWRTSGNIDFALAAAFPSTGQVFVSNPNIGSPWPEGAAQGSITQTAASIGGAYGNQLQGHGEVIANGLIQLTSVTNSWQSLQPGFGNNFFNNGGDGGIADIVTNPLEFDRVNQVSNGTGSNLGTFTLDSSGNLLYATAAVPEPSTVSAFILGASVLAFALRRRTTFSA